MDEEKPIDYEEFLTRLNLVDDKISTLLYDLYKYNLNNDEKDKAEAGDIENE